MPFQLENLVFTVCFGITLNPVVSVWYYQMPFFSNGETQVRADGEVAMTTGEEEVGSDGCLPLRQLCRKAGSAVRRAKGSVSSILKGTLAMLTRAPGPAAGSPRRKAVSWAQSVSQ